MSICGVAKCTYCGPYVLLCCCCIEIENSKWQGRCMDFMGALINSPSSFFRLDRGKVDRRCPAVVEELGNILEINRLHSVPPTHYEP
jgi:hypothetical protein